MVSFNPTVAVSAPGKVLLAGGYLVLDRAHTGLVFGLSARISVISEEITTGPGIELHEVVVESPQFVDAVWKYGYHQAPEGGGIKVTQLQIGETLNRNPFVEKTLNYALTYISQVSRDSGGGSGTIKPSRLIILADNDYYSNQGTKKGRFVKFTVPISGAHKTGLGSSAALVTSLTASLLSHYLPADVFDVESAAGQKTLHNLAQAAHCAAQGKIGSGFDVAAAVYGSSLYRRFSPETLGSLPEPGGPGFGEKLLQLVDEADWDVEVQRQGLSIPDGIGLRMCDVDCGSESVGMAKKVLAWKAADADRAIPLWAELQRRNEKLAQALRDGQVDELPTKLNGVRELIREMGKLSDVPIEPESQTELLNAASGVEGVYGGVVPGAGGYDAVVLVMKNDDATARRVEEFLAGWSKKTQTNVKLLPVKGEMQGARREALDLYAGWL